MNKAILILLFMGTLLFIGCSEEFSTQRYHEFKYVKLTFCNQTDTTFVNCRGGITNRYNNFNEQEWIIIDETGKTHRTRRSKLVDEEWEYTENELNQQVKEF